MKIGTIGWHDLSVPNAGEVKEFYEGVLGWSSQEVNMGDYNDYAIKAPEPGDGVAGICHARGALADYPPQWILYFIVADVEKSVERCRERGGEIVVDVRTMGDAKYCVIRDPAGAVCGLYGPAVAGENAEG